MQHSLRVAVIGSIIASFLAAAPWSVIAADTPQIVVLETTEVDDMDRELEILENEIAQLRRELRLRRMRDIYKTKEWQEHYMETKKRLNSWRAFQQKYLSQ